MDKQQQILRLLTRYKELDVENAVDFKKFNQYLVSHHSTSIEGSTLTYIETTVLLEQGLTPKGKPLVHTLMQKDHFEALVFALENAKTVDYTPSFIQQINAKVMHSTGQVYHTALGSVDATKGEYRKGTVFAGQTTFVNYAKIEGLVAALCQGINTKLQQPLSIIQQLTFAFEMHYELVYIHPFYDGNGRTSRLLMNALQTYFDLPLAIVFTEDKVAYIEALIAAKTAENTAPFVNLCLTNTKNTFLKLFHQLTMHNIPELRFPGFGGEWEKHNLGEIASFSKGKGISKADIAESGATECIRYGELYTTYGETIEVVKSKTNIGADNLVLSEANDVIIPASGETQIDIATASCVLRKGIALGGDLNILKTQNNGVFLSYYLNNKKKQEIATLAQGISVVHLYSSQLSILRLNLPSKTEQDKIALFLRSTDEKIQALKKKHNLLEQYKKGVMQRLFTVETDCRPSLRFKDANGMAFPDWEVKRLGEVTYKTDKKNKQREVLPVYSISNVSGFIPQGEQFEGMDSVGRGYDTSLYKIIEDDTFAYNPARINVGSIGFSGKIGRVIISSLYVCFKTNDNVNNLFFNQYLNTDHFKDSVLRKGEGGVRIYLFYENFAEIMINLPCLSEQTAIANFLSAIDEKINYTQNQITQMETWKKGLLQKMFV